jgi:hypothetical protein
MALIIVSREFQGFVLPPSSYPTQLPHYLWDCAGTDHVFTARVSPGTMNDRV